MTTVKRVSNSYTIETLDPSANILLATNTVVAGNNLLAANLTAFGTVSLPSGTVNAFSVISNVITANTLNLNQNATVGGAISAAGNVTGAVFFGDASGLTGIPAGNALGNIISFGTSQVSVPQISGNVFVNVSGVSNVAVFTSGGANIAGNLATGNILSGGFFFANGQPLTGSVKYDATPTAPASPNPGDFWFNTVNGILYQYNDDGDSEQWVDNSGIGTPPSSTSAVANSAIQRDSNASATANVYYGNGVIMTGTVSGGNLATNGTVSAVGNIASSANVSASYFLGNGAFLSGVVTSVNKINNGTSNVDISSPNGNVAVSVGGAANIAIFTGAGQSLVGELSATGNVAGGNIISSGAISAAGSVTAAGITVGSGNITNGNIISSGAISAAGSVTAAGITVGSGNITGGNITGSNIFVTDSISVNANNSATAIVNSGSNAVGNIGSSSSYFNRVFATSTSALYADIAEIYRSDQDYAIGTVISIGGSQEITISTRDHDAAVIGCVSDKPALIMNSASSGTAVALTGKVKCLVQGPIMRGDLLVSGTKPGYAMRLDKAKWAPGTVFAKAMEDFSGDTGTIDVLVGRY